MRLLARSPRVTLCLISFLILMALPRLLPFEDKVGGRAQAQEAKPPWAFTGVGSCTSSNCHGSVWPKTGSLVRQNEYQIWSTKDKHSGAYNVLLEPRSKQIARNLGIARPEAADICLDCHTLNVPKDQQAQSFDISDGVGCENCHGPAAAWLGPHTTRGWTHQQSVSLGMHDTKDLSLRTKRCLSCHIGDERKTVDHVLIAAGHPDLVFELDTFSALMPQHWNEEKGDWQGIRRWGVGQAVALSESMEQLARRARGDAWSGWPDFADLECSSCHHNLVLPSARQARGYEGKPGVPPWNPSRYVVFRQLVGLISGEKRRALDELVQTLKQALQNAATDRTRVAEAAFRIAQLTEQLIPQLETTQFSEQFAKNIMRAIAADASTISNSGIRAAEQATMALDALCNSYERNTGSSHKVLSAQIGRMYDSLQSTSRYDPDQFAADLRQIGVILQQ